MSTSPANDAATQTAQLLRLMGAAMQRDAQRAEMRTVVAPDAASLLDLTHRILQAKSTPVAVRIAADGLKELCDCTAVVIARCRDARCTVEAVSQVDVFDPHAESIVHYESVCREALADERSVAASGRWIKLYDDGSAPTFVCLVIDENYATSQARTPWLPRVAETIGPVLHAKLASLKQSPMRGFIRRWNPARRWDRRTAYAAVGIAALVALFPWPYRIACSCVVEPVTRRHVAAPFDGVFAESLCQLGDFVQAGQVLGRLDAKELRWELAAVIADRERAGKARDINYAAGKTAAAQVDRLEAQRLDERRKLLESRLENLEIKSPITGIVVTGDLERAEGAPVKTGQSLFEIAPLDRMVIETAVPEDEIDRVHLQQTVTVKLDSQWSSSIEGRVQRIYPRAEIRDDANVFLVESTIENADGKLRPGMKGTSAVRTDRRPLLWIVGHRLVESVYRWLS